MKIFCILLKKIVGPIYCSCIFWYYIFMNFTIFFDTIYISYCIISISNFYFSLQYFQKQVFSFSKINSIQTREIIVYSLSTINACSLLSHKWWIPLIKFMVGPTIYVRGGSTHLWYSGST